MALSPYVAGAGQSDNALLEAIAHEESEVVPENFVGNEIFPDVQVDSFEGHAPITYNDTLEAYDDDTVGKRSDYPEVEIVQSKHEYSLGFHARKFIIDTHDRIKAQQAAAFARPGSTSPLFDLEARFTRVITGQNARHNEIMKIIELTDTTKYPAGNVGASLAIDTATEATFLAALLTGAQKVERVGKGPANMIVIGDGASIGALANPNLRGLRGADGPQVFVPEAILPLLRLPEGQAKVRIATASYRLKKKKPAIPMMDQFIWIGRAATPNGKGDGFGANLWHPTIDNNQRFFVYRLVVGSQRNIHVSIENFYMPFVNDYSLGYIIPTTVAP